MNSREACPICGCRREDNWDPSVEVRYECGTVKHWDEIILDQGEECYSEYE